MRGGPPTFLGTGAVLGPCGGAEPRTRPGWEKLSSLDSLPQMLPMVTGNAQSLCTVEVYAITNVATAGD